MCISVRASLGSRSSVSGWFCAVKTKPAAVAVRRSCCIAHPAVYVLAHSHDARQTRCAHQRPGWPGAFAIMRAAASVGLSSTHTLFDPPCRPGTELPRPKERWQQQQHAVANCTPQPPGQPAASVQCRTWMSSTPGTVWCTATSCAQQPQPQKRRHSPTRQRWVGLEASTVDCTPPTHPYSSCPTSAKDPPSYIP